MCVCVYTNIYIYTYIGWVVWWVLWLSAVEPGLKGPSQRLVRAACVYTLRLGWLSSSCYSCGALELWNACAWQVWREKRRETNDAFLFDLVFDFGQTSQCSACCSKSGSGRQKTSALKGNATSAWRVAPNRWSLRETQVAATKSHRIPALTIKAPRWPER